MITSKEQMRDPTREEAEPTVRIGTDWVDTPCGKRAIKRLEDLEKTIRNLEPEGNQLRNKLGEMKDKAGFFPSKVEAQIETIRNDIAINETHLGIIRNDLRHLQWGIDETEKRWITRKIFEYPQRCEELRRRIDTFNKTIEERIKAKDYRTATELQEKRDRLTVDLESLEWIWHDFTGIKISHV